MDYTLWSLVFGALIPLQLEWSYTGIGCLVQRQSQWRVQIYTNIYTKPNEENKTDETRVR